MDLSQQYPTPIYLQQNLRLLRKRLKMSQEELATRVGLNRGNIASYENGTAEPKICNLLKLSNLFQVSIIDLTQKDLGNGHVLNEASEAFQQFSASDLELLQQYIHRAEDLREVVRSIHTCFHFRARTIEDLHANRELHIAVLKFEELYEAAQELLHNHQALLDFIKCHCHK
ncbi:MAG: helix-turn-helix transcriptional regulator [Phaeodactylibacter sp.]|nr:helix-turn-helix transcriptional regulator [Phaeodactylibacter sp.]MCB9276317.1 helix-turn-helix transcriptional regulator [Lewinellaceae bacterium]